MMFEDQIKSLMTKHDLTSLSVGSITVNRTEGPELCWSAYAHGSELCAGGTAGTAQDALATAITALDAKRLQPVAVPTLLAA